MDKTFVLGNKKNEKTNTGHLWAYKAWYAAEES